MIRLRLALCSTSLGAPSPGGRWFAVYDPNGAKFAFRVPDDSSILVTVSGDLDASNRTLLARAIIDGINAARQVRADLGSDKEPAVIVDLTGSDFVGTAAFDALEDCTSLTDSLRLVIPASGLARRVVQFLGLDGTFNVFENVDRAVAGI